MPSPRFIVRLARSAAAALVALVALHDVTSAGVEVRGAVRVVSQTVGSDELLLALARPEQVAALSFLANDPSFSAVAKEAEPFPRISRYGDAEDVLQYRPTLVLFADYSRKELVEQVQRAGVRVMTFDRYETLDDAFANLRLLAAELGTRDKAETLIADCQARVADLKRRLEGRPLVKVIAPSTYGVIPGTKSTFQDLCDHAGAENLAATLGGLVGHATPPNEQMLLWPIDRLVIGIDADIREALAPYRKLPPYSLLAATRENRVALVLPWQLSCVTHRRVDGYETLARALHPEAFE